jgi:2-dehydro-3-deoxyphosphogluconate aldolase/(4S)-4-hydroxy-2-oxoglutarate aldolase
MIPLSAAVLPVVTVDNVDDAVPLARALAAGGLTTIEVTLRTRRALPAIAAIAAHVPEVCVGAGTVLTRGHASAAVDAGAAFLVSPGCTPTVIDALWESGVPFLAGAATASEVISLLEAGVETMKFFPAAAIGGPNALKALAGPFPQVRFVPTGGIDPVSARAYLDLPNVVCVGGSWLTPPHAVARADFAQVEALAREAAMLRDAYDIA